MKWFSEFWFKFFYELFKALTVEKVKWEWEEDKENNV